MKFLKKLIRPIIYVALAIVLIIIVRAFDSRSMPKLYTWHTNHIDKELLVDNEYDNIDSYSI
jgi:hypothetical protein